MKKFLFGMGALLSVSLFFVGCEKEVEVEKWRDPAREILVPEAVATTPAQLTEYLASVSGYSVVGTSGAFLLSGDTVVPADKILMVQSGTFSTNSKKLTVKGKVYVNNGTTLTATDGLGAIVADGGSVTVLIGGNLSLATTASVVDAAGTLVNIKGGTLTVASLASADIAATLGYITKGELVVTALSNVASVKPSDITGITTISKDKRLKVTVTQDETVTAAFTIPEGLTLTASGVLTFNDNITVAGTFNPPAFTVAETKTLTVTGTLNATATLTVTGTAVIGDTTNKVTLTKAAVSAGTLSGATSTLDLIDPQTITLTNAGTIVVAGTGKVSLLHTEFGAGTYTADGGVVISSLTAGDTIVTPATMNKGLVLSNSSTELKLLGTAVGGTYTVIAADVAKVKVAGGVITVGQGATSDTSSVGANGTSSIVFGTGGAIALGNASKLILTTNATIGVFTNSPLTINATNGSLGGATFSTSGGTLVNGSGTLTATSAEGTLTGVAAGTSSIKADAVFVAGT
jgi:hypothetical protein